MGNEIMTVIRQVGIFIVCSQAVLHFKPKASYEKYIKLLVSVMVLIQLFIPVASFFGGGGSVEFEEKVASYQKAMKISSDEITVANYEIEQKLEEMTLEEIKSRLNTIESQESLETGSIEAYNGENREEENIAGIRQVAVERIEVLTNE